MESSYLYPKFVHRINPDRIRIIVECGSRDGLDSLALNQFYAPEKIYAFECNPEAIEICKRNLADSPVVLIEKAVYNENKVIDFFPTDMEKSTNKELGASSILWHLDNKESYFQKKTQVEAIRLDTFMEQESLTHIDLLCMDVQGAEIEVLEGLGKKLSKIKYIITEVAFQHYYEGDHLFIDVVRYLNKYGFHLSIGRGRMGALKEGFTDVLFQNKGRV